MSAAHPSPKARLPLASFGRVRAPSEKGLSPETPGSFPRTLLESPRWREAGAALALLLLALIREKVESHSSALSIACALRCTHSLRGTLAGKISAMSSIRIKHLRGMSVIVRKTCAQNFGFLSQSWRHLLRNHVRHHEAKNMSALEIYCFEMVVIIDSCSGGMHTRIPVVTYYKNKGHTF